MKHLPTIAGALLGLAFTALGLMVLLGLAPKQDHPVGSPMFHLMEAFGPTGYMKFVKVFEVIGGILVAIPRTRNLGLLALGPILLNILATHIFIMGGEGLFHPMIVVLCLLAVYLMWVERRAFANLFATTR